MTTTEAWYLEKWYQEHETALIKDYYTLLQFKSISTDPACKSEIVSAATWLSTKLSKLGFVVEKWEEDCHPVLFAKQKQFDPKKPTILIYHHYDVQPVDPLELWESDPFKPMEREGQIYARGASDNKGQLACTLFALHAMQDLGLQFPANISLIIEGEEECGSHGTAAIIEKKKKELAADVLLVIDCDMYKEGEPAVTVGLKGIASVNIVYKNSNTDLHSGIHGGITRNPIHALAQAVAKMWDVDGNVAIPGFYDHLEEIKPEDRAKLDLLFDEKKYTEQFGTQAFHHEKGFTPIEVNAFRPIIEVNGFHGGYGGEGVKTIIPAYAEVKISSRTVPGQQRDEVAQLIAEHFKVHAPKGMEVITTSHHGGPAVRISPTSPIVEAVCAGYDAIFPGTKTKRIMCGASIPITGLLAATAGAQPLLIGVGLPTDKIHAPNEHFGKNRLRLGTLSLLSILKNLSTAMQI